MPDRPDAWLLTVARRRQIDRARRETGRSEIDASLLAASTLVEEGSDTTRIPDRRLALLLVCAHPAIESGARTPLMLQTVIGLDAAEIAACFLTSPAAMAKRLVRAKARIRATGIAFELPDQSDLGERLPDLLEAIYAIYGQGWIDASGGDGRRRAFGEEALFLARLVAELLPDDPETLGLFALLLYCESRRAARRDEAGAYVPLDRQNVADWDAVMLEEAERNLMRAASLGRPGRFQIEAAIQSALAARAVTGHIVWTSVVQLHAALLIMAPTIGVAVAHAAALLESGEADAALAALDGLPASDVETYQPYWAVRADTLRRLGCDAQQATQRAIGLTEDPAVRDFLLARR